MRIVVAHDFGKLRDFAGDVIVVEPASGRAQVAHAERYPLGTSYRAQAQALCGRLGAIRQQFPAAQVALALDATGVGQAALEIVREAGAERLCSLLLAITFSGGRKVKFGRTRRELSVPKTILVDTARQQLTGRRIVLPPAHAFPAAAQLLREFNAYIARPTVRGGYRAGARREKDHDDLVSAFLIASFTLALDWAQL